jgi:[ribosomal protein S5]-alanine N-acetyltransferase
MTTPAEIRTHWNHPEVRKFLWDNTEVTDELVAKTIARGEAAQRDFGGGLWSMHIGPTFVGACGLLPVFSELDSLLHDAISDQTRALIGDAHMVEVLYSLEPAAWGQGFATEATRAMLDYAFADRSNTGNAAAHKVSLNIVFGGIDEPNTRSRDVLLRAGMTEIARFEGDNGPIVYFAATKPAIAVD